MNALAPLQTEDDLRWVYAVVTTGVYCRPGCPSRRPKPENIRFFPSPETARAAGFRACKRCAPDETDAADPNVALAARLCARLDADGERAPTLRELAEREGATPGAVRRIFSSVLGVTPREYAAATKRRRFRRAARTQTDVASAQFAAGYGSSSRLYEAAKKDLGMTPKRYLRKAAGLKVVYDIAPCALGWLLLARTETGLCSVQLGDDPDTLEALFRDEYAKASLTRSPDGLTAWTGALVDFLNGGPWPNDLPTDIRGTAFQAKVWRALKAIPEGETATYAEIAAAIGSPKAARAVGTACGANPVALVIPCHRVTPANGNAASGYRWGPDRKQLLLALEAARQSGRKSRGAMG